MCVRGRRPRERLNSPKDKPKTSADGSRHGLKTSPSPRHRSASWHGGGGGGGGKIAGRVKHAEEGFIPSIREGRRKKSTELSRKGLQ